MPVLIVLGLFESLDIDLYNGTGPIKRNSLSSEIQLFKVGRISKNPGKFPDPGQLFMKITVKVFIHKGICIVSDTIFGVKLTFCHSRYRS